LYSDADIHSNKSGKLGNVKMYSKPCSIKKDRMEHGKYGHTNINSATTFLVEGKLHTCRFYVKLNN